MNRNNSSVPRRRSDRQSNGQSNGRSNRKGVAFFVMVFAVVLVIVAAMMTLVRSEWMLAVRQAERSRIETMQRAISAATDTLSVLSTEQTITFPIDPARDERIAVTFVPATDKTPAFHSAQWLRGSDLIDMLQRKINAESNDRKSDDATNQNDQPNQNVDRNDE